MAKHVIVDFMHLYYKYLFTQRSGRLKTLTVENPENGNELDVTIMYSVLRDIEGIRKKAEEKEGKEGELIVSICVDNKSNERKKINEEYKAKRTKTLDETDYANIGLIQKTLDIAGYNIYNLIGLEADDVVYRLVQDYGSYFYYNRIYTIDSDLLVNVRDNVEVYISNTRTKTYKCIDKENFEDELSATFKTDIRYNNLMLYKCMCGDSSDNVKGIVGFGPSAFTKFVDTLSRKTNIKWDIFNDPDIVQDLLRRCGALLSLEQINQAIESLNMIRPQRCDIKIKTSLSTKEKRIEAYAPYKMKSLYE